MRLLAGTHGDAFLVDAEGRYRTASRTARALDHADLGPVAVHIGVCQREIQRYGAYAFPATTWVSRDRWMLVVQQDTGIAMAFLRHATGVGSVSVAVIVLLVAVIMVLLVRWLVPRRERLAWVQAEPVPADAAAADGARGKGPSPRFERESGENHEFTARAGAANRVREPVPGP